MIPINELRIGNKISAGGLVYMVRAEHIKEIQDGNNSYSPVVLDKEALKSSCQRYADESFYTETGEKIETFSVYFHSESGELHIRYLSSKEYIMWFKWNPKRGSLSSEEVFIYQERFIKRGTELYAHQLQNLHFALTGEELNIAL